MQIPDNNLGYPVKISIGGVTGSGFLVRQDTDVYLVTAKHVIYPQNQTADQLAPYGAEIAVLCAAEKNGKVVFNDSEFKINLAIVTAAGHEKLHPGVDIVVIKVANIDLSGKSFNFVEGVHGSRKGDGNIVLYVITTATKYEDVQITNDVFVLGYPSSLSAVQAGHLDYDAPLARKGIVAGKNGNNRTIILDCPVYGGNSGGIALQKGDNGQFTLIGVVTQFVPFLDQWQSIKFPGLINTHVHNSGYSVVIPTDCILELIQKIETEDPATKPVVQQS